MLLKLRFCFIVYNYKDWWNVVCCRECWWVSTEIMQTSDFSQLTSYPGSITSRQLGWIRKCSNRWDQRGKLDFQIGVGRKALRIMSVVLCTIISKHYSKCRNLCGLYFCFSEVAVHKWLLTNFYSSVICNFCFITYQ